MQRAADGAKKPTEPRIKPKSRWSVESSKPITQRDSVNPNVRQLQEMTAEHFDFVSKRGSVALYRDRAASDERKTLSDACNALEAIIDGLRCSSKLLDSIYLASVHSVKNVWETGILILSQVAQDEAIARDYLKQISTSSDSRLRFRSVQHLTDNFTREFCLEMVLPLIGDTSIKVAHAACWRAITLDLTEASEPIRERICKSPKRESFREMEMIANLLDRGFYEYNDVNGYHVAIVCTDLYPARVIWPGSVEEGEIEKVGLKAIWARVQSIGPPTKSGRRPWKWQR